MPWVGRPTHGPALVIRGSTLYGSWNGETGVASWQVLAGPSPSRLGSLGTVSSQGFETTIDPRVARDIREADRDVACVGEQPAEGQSRTTTINAPGRRSRICFESRWVSGPGGPAA